MLTGELLATAVIGALALSLAACGDITYQSSLVKPATAGRAHMAGVGDTVVDLKQTQSLPNAFGKADIFGGTRDAGRVTVRLVGVDGGQAFFVRQDVLIQSNETTMTQGPVPVPVYQGSVMNGSIGSGSVQTNRTTWATGWVPPTPAYSYPMQAGQTQLVAPIGGSMMVEGRRLNILRATSGGIEYSVD